MGWLLIGNGKGGRTLEERYIIPGAAVGPARPSPYPAPPLTTFSVPARAFLHEAIDRVGHCHYFCVAGKPARIEECPPLEVPNEAHPCLRGTGESSGGVQPRICWYW